MTSQIPPAARPVQRREILAWALCDWANSAYSALSITILVVYITQVVLPGNAGKLAWGWGLGLSMFCAACISPVLGAMADACANKWKWLCGTALLGAAGGVSLGLLPTDWPWAIVGVFFLTTLMFELSFGFYNSFLPELADGDSMNRVSAWGFALGYVGGGVALLIAVLVLSLGDRFGLTSIAAKLRCGLLIMGAWWGVFTLPAVAILRDRRPARQNGQPLRHVAAQGVREVLHTIANVRRYRTLAVFLLGFLLYNEGIQTVMSQASVFATDYLKIEAKEMVLVVLMIQFAALPGAMFVGWLADRIGQKPALMLCLATWSLLLVYAYFVTSRREFWVMGAVVALVMGGTQSISRAIMGSMTPPARTAEFFGFFNLSARATSMVGPILFVQVLTATGNANLAIFSLLGFILAGWLIVSRIHIERGREDALSQ
ncbi:MAG: MFS transporter [Planctomycetes bacterium]|nr:MFS transporter [Planctomycetota bacterium]